MHIKQEKEQDGRMGRCIENTQEKNEMGNRETYVKHEKMTNKMEEERGMKETRAKTRNS
jgi:hypothetical protein